MREVLKDTLKTSIVNNNNNLQKDINNKPKVASQKEIITKEHPKQTNNINDLIKNIF